MNFEYSKEHLAFKEMATNFAHDKLKPFSRKWDEKAYFPVDTLKEAAALGMSGMVAREDIGGAGMTRLDAAIVFEALAQGCVTTSAYLSIHNMVTTLIDTAAEPALRAIWGPKLTRMEVLASYCLTEPEAGSDAASLSTRAIRQGDKYIVNGCKAFISGASVSDIYLCMVRTTDDPYHGISCLLIEKDTPGLSFGKLEHKMGWRSQPTAMVHFDDCQVPVNHLVGQENEGFKLALQALNGGRVNIAACSLGGAATCLELTQRYLNERHQFKQPLAKMQALRFYFADMVTAFHAARLMVYQAAEALDKKKPDAALYCAMAKQYATELAFKISDKAMQLHGGYGYLADYEIERLFRDLRVHQILEGTNEIMREIIAKATLDKFSFIN